MKRIAMLLIVLSSIGASSGWAQIPQTMSYQGVLTDGLGTPVADANYDLTFRIYTVSSGGTEIWSETQTVLVSGGIFSAVLGSSNALDIAFDQPYWMGVSVDGGTEYTPRRELTATPYSLNSQGVADSAITSAKVASGQLVRAVNSLTDSLTLAAGANVTIVTSNDSLIISAAGPGASLDWSLTGNAGTTAGTNFVGTTDDQALEIHVNSVRALRIEPDAISPTLIGGHLSNDAGSAAGVTIAGGGATANSNRVTDDYGVVSGGANNLAGNNIAPTSDETYATVGGGQNNVAARIHSTVGGGIGNQALFPVATVGGGDSNTASGTWATIGGGRSNSTSQTASTVSGGEGNRAFSSNTTISGGFQNFANNNNATIGGGLNNTASGVSSTIGGGETNTAAGAGIHSVIAGGETNSTSASWASVGGGTNNDASGQYSSIGGGQINTASSQSATVAGGQQNEATNSHATVAGGAQNVASGLGASIPGGRGNAALGDYSFAAGRLAKANHDGAFVWADSSSGQVASTGTNQFIVRASGGIWLGTTSSPSIPGGQFISTSTGGYLSTGGAWTNSSDEALKENFTDVDALDVLERLDALSISQWNYRSEGVDTPHMGPTAQGFRAAFDLGADDTHIATVDADGVALAAIKGLHAIVKEKDAEIAELRHRLERIEALMRQLSRDSAGKAAAVK